jgi:hypothetical protein
MLPWWGWVIIVVIVGAVIVPLKLKMLKKMLAKNKEHEDF